MIIKSSLFKINGLERTTKKYEKYREQITEIVSLLKFYKKDIKNCNDNYIKTIVGIIESREFLIDKKGNLTDKYGEKLNDDQISIVLNKYLDSLSAFKHLSFLKYAKSNAVFVGSNGSGKTTLIRELQNSLDSNDILFFPADRMLSFNGSTVSSDTYLGIKEEIDFAYKYAIGFDEQSANYSARLFYLYLKLLKESRFYELSSGKNGNSYEVINKWNELIKTRELFYEHELYAKPTGSDNMLKYDIKYLSSGEKSILFFLMVILLNAEKPYYFIDEPENNLNPAIVSEVWDYLESKRPNSTFVYLTHDSGFAISRTNCKEYWMKGFDGTRWDYQEIPEEGSLPKDLLIELLGSKQTIIFCESEDKSQLDYIFFKVLFPDCNIVPSGGCDKVISNVKAYKSLKSSEEAYGIIDCDYKDQKYLSALSEDNIFHLPYFEIENMLISEPLLKGVILNANKKECPELIDKVKRFVKTKFVSNENVWIVRHVAFDLRDKFNYHDRIKVLKNISEFKILYNKERLNEKEIDLLACKYKTLFDSIVGENDYDLFLKYLDCKGLIKECEKILKLRNKTSYIDNLLSFLKAGNSEIEIKRLRSEIIKKV